MDTEAIAWAAQKLQAFAVDNSTMDNALMMDRLYAMLAAAPTPPAGYSKEWCMEAARREEEAGDPPISAGMRTPPAQEDEPVAYEVEDPSGNWRLVRKGSEFAKHGYEVRPLYTRPDDKLRKLAQEYIEYMCPGADVDRSSAQIFAFLYDFEKKLRAALEGQTALQAATRCFVASKFGPEVSE